MRRPKLLNAAGHHLCCNHTSCACCIGRFAFHDYNRLAAEDERDVGDSTDIDGSDDWMVTDDDEGDDDGLGRMGQDGIATAEAPF